MPILRFREPVLRLDERHRLRLIIGLGLRSIFPTCVGLARAVRFAIAMARLTRRRGWYRATVAVVVEANLHRENAMIRREMLGALSVSAAGLVGAIGRGARGGHENLRDEVHRSCFTNWQACKRECHLAVHHCYAKLTEGDKAYAKALQLVADCAAFCVLSATLIARRSPLVAHACSACALACQDCGTECDKLKERELNDCARACPNCETTCRSMVKSLGGHYQ
jgi:hypothetical protein